MNRFEIETRLDKEFLTVNEAGQILTMTDAGVIRKIGRGQLEGVNINPGGKNAVWRIRSRSVRKLLGLEDNIPA
jgi:hypothetical protein